MYTLRVQKSTSCGGNAVTSWQAEGESERETSQNHMWKGLLTLEIQNINIELTSRNTSQAQDYRDLQTEGTKKEVRE
jgi:hypothetical protein